MPNTKPPPPSTRSGTGRPPRQRHARANRETGDDSSASRWSRHVMETSNALDLEAGIFKTGTAEEIAQSLKCSALLSRRRKGTPFQSAMSMLNFYINRAGTNLPKARREVLEEAKRKLREAFGRAP